MLHMVRPKRAIEEADVKSNLLELHPGWWLFLVVWVLGCTLGVASAQSLAELAKKEKERRSKIESEDTRVITERDLQSSFNVLPASAPEGQAEGEGAAGGESSGDMEDESEEPDETKTREYWQKRVQDTKKKIQDLEQKLKSPELNWGEGMRTDVNPIGQRNLSTREETEKQLAAAKAELQAIQEEGRRAGVPAGWLR